MFTNAELIDKMNALTYEQTNTETASMLQETVEALKFLIRENELNLSLQASQQYKILKLDNVKSHIETAIENEDIEDDELKEPFWEELCEMLGIENTTSMDVSVSVTYSLTVKGPRNMTTDDILEELTFNEPEVSWSSEYTIESSRETDTSIDEN